MVVSLHVFLTNNIIWSWWSPWSKSDQSKGQWPKVTWINFPNFTIPRPISGMGIKLYPFLSSQISFSPQKSQIRSFTFLLCCLQEKRIFLDKEWIVSSKFVSQWKAVFKRKEYFMTKIKLFHLDFFSSEKQCVWFYGPFVAFDFTNWDKMEKLHGIGNKTNPITWKQVASQSVLIPEFFIQKQWINKQINE